MRLEQVERLHALLVVAVAALGWLTRCVDPWSVAAGGAVMGANVWLMRKAFGHALRPGGTWRRLAAMALLLVKTGLLLCVAGLLLWATPINGMAFAVGVTLFPVAAVGAAVWVQTSVKRES